MINVSSIDLSGLDALMFRVQTELHKTAREVLETTGGRLVKDLVDATPPKDLAKAQSIAAKDVRRVFAPMPADVFTGKQKGKGDPQWLVAGPQFLIGADREKSLKSGGDMLEIYRANPNGRLGNKFWKLGKRGQQNVSKINRYLVSRARLNRFTKLVQDRFGKMKAGWAMGWDTLKVKGRRPPKWVARHIAKGNALGSVHLALDGDKPSITIENHARGVEGEASLRAIKSAVAKRFSAMKIDLENQLKGLYKRVTA